MTAVPDVVVVGGGVIGLAVARELASRNASVMLLERSSPGREASWAAAGMLSPLGEAADMPHLRELAEASLDLWPGFAGAIQADTGVDLEYRTDGALHVALDESGERTLASLRERAGAVGARPVDAAGLGELEPNLAPAVRAGLILERDHRVDNRRLAPALWASAHAAGVEFRLGTAARGVVVEEGRAAGVALGGGGILAAGAVVIAAGSRAGELTGMPAPLPVRPVRGQMFALRPADGRPLVGRVIVGPRCYLVPRQDGRTLVGATVEEVGFATGPTPAGIAALIDAAAALVPAIRDLPLVETWAGFRPGTPDDRPILGADPDVAGLFHAAGHFRNGILLAPVTASIMADLILGGTPVTDPGPFSVARFRTGDRRDEHPPFRTVHA